MSAIRRIFSLEKLRLILKWRYCDFNTGELKINLSIIKFKTSTIKLKFHQKGIEFNRIDIKIILLASCPHL